MFNKFKIKSNHIKSYVIRSGRLTQKQERSLANYVEKYMINYDPNKTINFGKVFSNTNPVVLEIGFGMGWSLIEMSLNNPKNNYLGIDVYKAGIGNILYEIEHQNIPNLLVMNYDAVDILNNMIANESLSVIQIYFPDPWHKKKHNKRRLVNQSNIDIFAKKLKIDGVFHFASDWLPYSEDVLFLLENNTQYQNMYTGLESRPEWRPLTKFEKRGKKLEYDISDILFKKV